MSRIVRVAESSLRATCFTALVVCQAVACGSSSGTPDADQGLRSDAGAEIIGDGATAGDSSGRSYPSPSPESIPLFDEGTIVDFYVTFSDDAWNNLLTLTGPNDTRWVPCTFTALGEPVVNADCRRKADMADWPYEKKPQFIVRFNLTNKAGRFRGLAAIALGHAIVVEPEFQSTHAQIFIGRIFETRLRVDFHRIALDASLEFSLSSKGHDSRLLDEGGILYKPPGYGL